MKITDKRGVNFTTFGELSLEDIFEYDDRILMKVSFASDALATGNAYDFTKSRLTSFDADTKVERIDSELILRFSNAE